MTTLKTVNLESWPVNITEIQRKKKVLICEYTQRINKTCEKYRAAAENGADALNFDPISQLS